MLAPFEAALRLGPVLAWELTRLSATGWDALFVSVAPILAAFLCHDAGGRGAG